ncbi:MAG: hypothetical protein WAQ24_04915 [Candidatus Saccharimonadales bacterium]
MNAEITREITSKIIDEIIRYGVLGAVVTTGLLTPGILQALDKPFGKLIKILDTREYERQARRETQRVIRYMKQQGLLAGNYEHGLQVTEKARKRLARSEFRDRQVRALQQWDGYWRIVLYDVPEDQKSARDALGHQLRRFGCFQLQKSTWITPFPCRDDIVQISTHYGVDSYVTYFEAVNLDNEKVLLARFKKRYPATKFSQPKPHRPQ